MSKVLKRDCYDPRFREWRLLAVLALVLLAASALWHGIRGRLVYHVARSSIGCPGRESLIAAALRGNNRAFPDQPELWRYNLAKPGWIAWSSVRESVPLGNGMTLPKWQVTVADSNLVVRGAVAGDRLALPPGDEDGDGLCEVVMELGFHQDKALKDKVCWIVLRLGDEHNEIVWVGLLDESIWHSRGIALKPIWRDDSGDGLNELVFITREAVRSPGGGIVFKPPQTIAVFKWDRRGGMLVPKQLPGDAGITPWAPPNGVPVQVDQDTALGPLVRELLHLGEQSNP